MINLKDDINDYIREQKGFNNALKEALVWHNTMLSDEKSKIVEKVNSISFFEPGKLYKFRYDPKTQKLPFYDITPLVLSLGQRKFEPSGTVVDIGLNLNFLPWDIRIFLLNYIGKTFEKKLEQQTNWFWEGKAKAQEPLDISYDKIAKIVKALALDYAVRNYLPGHKSEVSVISYDGWVPGMVIQTDNFVNTSREKIDTSYYTYMAKKKAGKVGKLFESMWKPKRKRKKKK